MSTDHTNPMPKKTRFRTKTPESSRVGFYCLIHRCVKRNIKRLAQRRGVTEWQLIEQTFK